LCLTLNEGGVGSHEKVQIEKNIFFLLACSTCAMSNKNCEQGPMLRFKNIFAEKFVQKLAFLSQYMLNHAKI
jgi:hypothetical protein